MFDPAPFKCVTFNPELDFSHADTDTYLFIISKVRKSKPTCFPSLYCDIPHQLKTRQNANKYSQLTRDPSSYPLPSLPSSLKFQHQRSVLHTLIQIFSLRVSHPSLSPLLPSRNSSDFSNQQNTVSTRHIYVGDPAYLRSFIA